jgi:hypothetical protein
LMFWSFHGLGSSRYVGELLAARYAHTADDADSSIDDLLAQLDAAERQAPSAPQSEAAASDPA